MGAQHFFRLPEGVQQAGVFRPSAARNIERRTVVDRGADKRQADGDVNAVIHPEIFHRDQALVVILGDHNVELPAPGAHKNGIAGPGR